MFILFLSFSAIRLNSFVSSITIFSGRMFVSFVLRYNLPLDKEGIYCKTPKLDNHNHFVT
ncbi:hypothetical protein FTO65_27075 [Bacillus cereus]|nr:hypothetical protein [Bacillus cereus]